MLDYVGVVRLWINQMVRTNLLGPLQKVRHLYVNDKGQLIQFI